MRFKPLILIVAVAGSTVLASDQLKFSQDTCEFTSSNRSITIGGRPSYPDSFLIKNMTDTVMVIDTLRLTWKIYSKTQTDWIGVSFDTMNNGIGNGVHCAAYSSGDFTRLHDTIFCIDTRIRQQQFRIGPRKNIGLSGFLFGRCILCAGLAKKQSDDELVSITLVFVNNRKGRDTVVFRGEYGELIQSGVSGKEPALFSVTPENSSREHQFLASGRHLAAFGEMQKQKRFPANIYFTKSARVPVMVNKKSR